MSSAAATQEHATSKGNKPEESQLGAPDAGRHPVEFLQHYGWTPDGDPSHALTRWLDPTKPLKETSAKEYAGTRQLDNGQEEEVYQLRVTPAALPCTRQDALAIQLYRLAMTAPSVNAR